MPGFQSTCRLPSDSVLQEIAGLQQCRCVPSGRGMGVGEAGGPRLHFVDAVQRPCSERVTANEAKGQAQSCRFEKPKAENG